MPRKFGVCTPVIEPGQSHSESVRLRPGAGKEKQAYLNLDLIVTSGTAGQCRMLTVEASKACLANTAAVTATLSRLRASGAAVAG